MNGNTNQEKLDNTRDIAHPRCVVCSSANMKGLNMQFNVIEEGKVESTFLCEDKLEGYPGMMHGGVISSVLDGAMGNCMFACGKTAVTIEMTVRFRHPVVIGKHATVSAKLTRASSPLYLLEAQITQNDEIRATAKGKFYHLPNLKTI